MEKLILAVILAVVQTSPPTPRQAPNNPTGAAHPSQEERSPKNNVATQPVPVTNPSQSPSAQRNEAEHSAENAQNAITVRELPPVSITRNRADWGYWLFSLGMLIVGTLQAFILGFTIRAINRQTTVTQSSQRGWMVSSRPYIGPDSFNNLFYNCRAKNIGQTSCKILESGVGFSRTDSLANIPPVPIYSKKTQFNEIVVAPREWIAVKTELSPPLKAGEYEAMRDGKLFIYGYAFVKYLDIFSKTKEDIRETRFCHRCQAPPPGTPGYIINPCIEAPREYHKAT